MAWKKKKKKSEKKKKKKKVKTSSLCAGDCVVCLLSLSDLEQLDGLGLLSFPCCLGLSHLACVARAFSLRCTRRCCPSCQTALTPAWLGAVTRASQAAKQAARKDHMDIVACLRQPHQAGVRSEVDLFEQADRDLLLEEEGEEEGGEGAGCGAGGGDAEGARLLFGDEVVMSR